MPNRSQSHPSVAPALAVWLCLPGRGGASARPQTLNLCLGNIHAHSANISSHGKQSEKPAPQDKGSRRKSEKKLGTGGEDYQGPSSDHCDFAKSPGSRATSL